MESRTTNSSHDLSNAFKYLSNAFDLTKLKSQVAKRDQAMLAIDTLRVNELFESIEEKFGNKELTAHEYLLYALLTDDVMKLDASILMSILDYTNDIPANLRQSLEVTLAAVRYAKEESEVAKKHSHQALINKLCEDRSAENTHRSVFVNLAGIQLSGLDSTVRRTNKGQNTYSPDLSFCNLRGATFTNLNPRFLTMRFSDASSATFTNTEKGLINGGDYLSIRYCNMQGSQFNNITATNIDWSNSDFTNAIFTNSTIGQGCFTETNFTNAQFNNSALIGSTSYTTRRANFTNTGFRTAKFSKFSHEHNDFTAARFINPANNITDEITRVTTDFISRLSGSPPYIKHELAAFQQIIKKDVERYVKSLNLNQEDETARLNKIMQHDLFHYRYFEPTQSLIAEAFPRQQQTIIFYDNYTDEKFTADFNKESLNTHKGLYAKGMQMLKELSHAFKNQTQLEHYIKKQEKLFISKFDDISAFLKQNGMPSEMLKAGPETLLQQMYLTKPKRMSDLDNTPAKAIALSQMFFGLEVFKAVSNNDAIEPKKIVQNLQNWHPLMTLRYDKESNCIFPHYLSGKTGSFHSADDMIAEFTSEKRLATPTAPSPKLSSLKAGMFATNDADNDNNEPTQKNHMQLTI